ncbi:MAG: ATP synthase F1 subunit delta [Flavobacteriales bacterium]|nr:ATP synthase F1 subunit delta [Flavobacteriales bacterium]
MSLSKAAKRYAVSLLDLAKEKGLVDQCMSDMELINTTVSESKDLELLLKSPVVNTDKKTAIFDSVFGAHLNDLSKAFVNIITAKGRENLLGEIAASYISLVKADRNILVAEVTTATKLSDGLRQEVLSVVSKMQEGEVELVEKIDPSIVGGFLLRVGDKMIDSSVQSKFRKLRQEFTGNSYVSSMS